MTRIICVNTGTKFSKWYVDNLKYMIDTYSNIEYDEFIVLCEEKYDLQVANKLLMFDKFRDGQNIYFDLDIIITSDCNNFISKNLRVCHAYWRPHQHTPINSSIISWEGDYSHIYKNFDDNSDFNLLKYNRGIDQYLYEENMNDIHCYTNHNDYHSYNYNNNLISSIVLFNQAYNVIQDPGWWTDYILKD